MRSRLVTIFAACLGAVGVTACGLGGSSSSITASPLKEAQLVPKAQCGPDDRADPALQGQVPFEHRQSGLSQIAYNCNMELVGQYQGEGASWQFAWYGDCAYHDTAGGSGIGTVVIDAADPAQPVATDNLTTPAMLDPWESLKVSHQRGLLAGVQNAGPGFAVYNVASDCREPILLSSGNINGGAGHEGNIAPDGFTYYGSSLGHVYAIDIAEPTSPRPLAQFPLPVHGLSISEDGSRAYFAQFDVAGNGQPGTGQAPRNGLTIMDVSSVQARSPAAAMVPISTFYWHDGSAAQSTQPIRVKGRPYIVYFDELGAGGLAGGTSGACSQGLPPYGMARIIDINDERNPVLVSRLMLEIHDPANCDAVIRDTVGQGIFGYDTHYCTVDDPREATVLGCGHQQAGIRVFDIRDPYHPKEIAYYNPAATGDQALSGSNHSTGGNVKTADWCSANVRFVPERGELWTSCQDNGFLILKFTHGVWPFKD